MHRGDVSGGVGDAFGVTEACRLVVLDGATESEGAGEGIEPED